jgi:hypothetical protein
MSGNFTATVTISLEQYEKLKVHEELNADGRLAQKGADLMIRYFNVISDYNPDGRRAVERDMNEFINRVRNRS